MRRIRPAYRSRPRPQSSTPQLLETTSRSSTPALQQRLDQDARHAAQSESADRQRGSRRRCRRPQRQRRGRPCPSSAPSLRGRHVSVISSPCTCSDTPAGYTAAMQSPRRVVVDVVERHRARRAQRAAAHDHREHDQSGHGEHRRPRQPWRPRRPRRAVPPAVLDHAGRRRPGGAAQRHVRHDHRLSAAGLAVAGLGLAGLGTVMFVWGGRPFLTGARQRAAGPAARDDAADRAGHHRGLRRLVGCPARPAQPRTGVLVGAGSAHRDHAARALDRDALPGGLRLGARLAGGAAARHRRTGRGRRNRRGRARRPARRRRGGRPPRRPGPRRRRGRLRQRQRRRVHDHRRVAAGGPRRRRSRRRRHRVHRLVAAGPGGGHRRGHRSGRHPAAGQPRRRTRPPGRNCWPTVPPPGCSGSRWSPP